MLTNWYKFLIVYLEESSSAFPTIGPPEKHMASPHTQQSGKMSKSSIHSNSVLDDEKNLGKEMANHEWSKVVWGTEETD